MAEQGNEMTVKLLELMERTGYSIVQNNGQRKFGPPPDWTGPPPPKGCEVFVGKLPRDIFEDELQPIFSRVGKIFEMRLMMDFSGSNRGYAFVTYTSRLEAFAAVTILNNYEIRPGRYLGVVKSVDNCRLFIGNIPKSKTKEEIYEELTKRAAGIVNVILYKNCFDRRFNRGFAFVEFTSHRAAAMARRALVPGCVKMWDQDIVVDWAEPEPDINDDLMKKVKVLYARNFQIKTTSDIIQAFFEKAIDSKIERVKKIYDYAFIHFYERKHAELAFKQLQNAEIDGSVIELKWAKPVDRDLYRIQKLSKGNAKFNNTGLDLSQTLLLYKQHLDKREYMNTPKDDEGIGSACAGESTCGSTTDLRTAPFLPRKDYYNVAPHKLESICQRYSWALPIYETQNYVDIKGQASWVCEIVLPYIGLPLLTTPCKIGPLISRPWYTAHEAQVEAAELALHRIKMLRTELIQSSAAHTRMPATYNPVIPSCIGIPYDYTISNPLYSYSNLPSLPVNVPAIWRSI